MSPVSSSALQASSNAIFSTQPPVENKKLKNQFFVNYALKRRDGGGMAGDYGAVERLGEAEAATLRPQGRRTMPKFIAPVLVLIVAGCACVLVSALYRADSQMSQVSESLRAAVSWRPLACDDVGP